MSKLLDYIIKVNLNPNREIMNECEIKFQQNL